MLNIHGTLVEHASKRVEHPAKRVEHPSTLVEHPLKDVEHAFFRGCNYDIRLRFTCYASNGGQTRDVPAVPGALRHLALK